MPCKINSPAVWTIYGGFFDVVTKEKSLAGVDAEMGRPGFWDDSERARRVTRHRQQLTVQINAARDLKSQAEEGEILRELVAEDPDGQEDYRLALERLEGTVEERKVGEFYLYGIGPKTHETTPPRDD